MYIYIYIYVCIYCRSTLFCFCEASFDLAGYACSMRRGEKQGSLLSRQRSSLPGFRAHLSSQLQCLLDSEGICFETSFADQGIGSQKLVPLAHKLAKIFPALAPHDLYRFDSVQKLIDLWDEESSGSASRGVTPATALDILACGVRLPAGVESPGPSLARDARASLISTANEHQITSASCQALAFTTPLCKDGLFLIETSADARA